MTKKRFGMYQNILYDDGDILNPFDAMKLLNYFDKENTKLKEENKQLKDALNQRTEQCDKYYKENEQLKIENQSQSDAIDGLQEIMAHYDLEELE